LSASEYGGPMTTTNFAIIGGGNMGAALADGLLSSKWIAPDELAIVEVIPELREQLLARFPGTNVTDTVPPCSSALIAVKPPDAPAAASDAARAGAKRIVSIAAGVSIATLEAAAGAGVAVIRTMPNTPALVGLGAAGMSAGTSATDADVEWARGILAAVGIVEIVPEYQLDAVTGLAGSGPAYLFLVAEALSDAGVLAGLSRPTAEALVAQLFLGSATMLSQRGNPTALRAMVTSPGGTTAAGVKVLEDQAVRAAFQSAVIAATERSRDLGRTSR
jgi:pyrroline-5-carboxylate reductase